VVGIGPGGSLDRTHRAEGAIAKSSVVVGYTTYVELVGDLIGDREVISTGMTGEVERCRRALGEALRGETVALVSSGDPGIYGMAGLVLELCEAEELRVPVEIVPGVTAAGSVAARLGAPLMLDFACISLSDLLVPWERIRERLEAVAAADLVCVLYNPRSKRRTKNLPKAQEFFLRHRPATTPVGIGTAVGREDERIVLTTLDELPEEEINMRSTVVIGNRSTREVAGLMLTPRGYEL
jgi:precorrin-3B C17-methyltransferase